MLWNKFLIYRLFFHNKIINMRQKTLEQEFWNKVKKTSTCWLWTGSKSNGYGRFKSEPAQRAAYRFTYGDFDRWSQILHKCDNPLCVRPEHLFPGTIQDNMADMMRKGRQQRGEGHWKAKLDWDKVNEIRNSYPRKSIGELARRYRVRWVTIRQVIKGRTWKV
jgi:hypothetical protein